MIWEYLLTQVHFCTPNQHHTEFKIGIFFVLHPPPYLPPLSFISISWNMIITAYQYLKYTYLSNYNVLCFSACQRRSEQFYVEKQGHFLINKWCTIVFSPHWIALGHSRAQRKQKEKLMKLIGVKKWKRNQWMVGLRVWRKWSELLADPRLLRGHSKVNHFFIACGCLV